MAGLILLLVLAAGAVLALWRARAPSAVARPAPVPAAPPAATVAAPASAPAEPAGPTPQHTNRLAREKSPYLLQHAHNPVDWFPWGEEALAKARRENKPIFLSVGYSTCYWCHVMEQESFETEEVAKVMNEHYVAIKVDREERPDLDEQYMLATQLVTGRGGWPNSVWLTPEGKPWMAGTYFPKAQFLSALTQLAAVWKDRRAEVDKQAAALAAAIADAGKPPLAGAAGPTPDALTPALIEGAVAALTSRFDPVHAGFGPAPKFPPHGALQLLLRRHRDTRDAALLTPITRTLDAMWLGGLHDHVGGGFHRYSTDERWLVPHFEKMLYDNAQLMRNYTDAFRATGHERYREAVADIFGWVQREMTSPEGAFYSAIDSGEVGGEGEAYVWRTAEVAQVLGPEDGALFAEVYALAEDGNYAEEASGRRAGANIPHLPQPLAAVAAARGAEPAAFAQRIAALRARLLAARQTRRQPHKDDKVLTGWNGLMIAALAHAGQELGEPRYTAAAGRAAEFILGTMAREGRLLRTYRDGEAKLPGYLDDYAYFAEGLLALHRATGEARWLREADRLATDLLRDFQDAAGGGFFFTAAYHENLIMRSKSLGGGGNVPDANGVAAQVLLELADVTGNVAAHTAARRALEGLAGLMARSPFSTEHLLLAATRLLGEPSVPSLAARPGALAGAATPAAPADPDVAQRADVVTIRAYASRLAVGPGGRLEVAVAIDIDEGWHLYGENPDAEFLVPTTVAVAASAPFIAGEVRAPTPQRARDAILDQMLNTHTGRIWFRVPVTVAADAPAGAVTLAFAVRTQACDASRCLQPRTTELKLPLQIDPAAPSASRHPGLFASGGE